MPKDCLWPKPDQLKSSLRCYAVIKVWLFILWGLHTWCLYGSQKHMLHYHRYLLAI